MTEYSPNYEFSNVSVSPEKLSCTFKFGEKYLKDWSNRWSSSPGVQEMLQVLKSDFIFELFQSGNVKISCSNYKKEHIEFLKPELLFHFRDFCHNVTNTLRELGVCPCSLKRGVDCIGEDLDFGTLAKEFRVYLRAVLKEAIDMSSEFLSKFEKGLSSKFGHYFPFISQIGLRDQVDLFVLTSLHSREAKDIQSTIKRVMLEAKGPSKNDWAMADLDISSFTEFSSDLSNHMGFMLGVYSNQTSAVGLYVGIVGLSASILIFSQTLETYLRIIVSIISGSVLVLTCLRWYSGRVSNLIREGIASMKSQISSRLS
jgi:hypothetical protein